MTLDVAIRLVARHQIGFNRGSSMFLRAEDAFLRNTIPYDQSDQMHGWSDRFHSELRRYGCQEGWKLICEAVKTGELPVEKLFERIGHEITHPTALRELGFEDNRIKDLLKNVETRRIEQFMSAHAQASDANYGRNGG